MNQPKSDAKMMDRLDVSEMIEFLEREQRRVKEVLNQSGFDFTSAPYVIIRNYRQQLKDHIKLLNENL